MKHISSLQSQGIYALYSCDFAISELNTWGFKTLLLNLQTNECPTFLKQLLALDQFVKLIAKAEVQL